MSATNVAVGSTVKVDVLVPDGTSGMYLRTVLLDADNTAIGVSPLDLGHVSGGLYSGTFTMPDTVKVTTITTLYTDGNYDTPHPDYYPVMDEFVLQDVAAEVDAGAIAGAVWDEDLSTHVGSGTAGNALQNISAGADPETIAAAVWDENPIPVNPLLDNDARLDNLDATISSRESETNAADRYSEIQDAIAGIDTPTIDFTEVLEAIDGIPTNPLLTDDARLDNLDAPISGVSSDAAPQYRCRMSAAYSNGTETTRIIVWAEKDGQRVVGEGADIAVVSQSGDILWSAVSITPNADGVFSFSSAVQPTVDTNYYVIISIEVDGEVRTSHEPFITVG